jgi:WD40 repeat protein
VSLAVLDGQHATAAPGVTAAPSASSAPSASPVAATVTTGHGALLDTLAVSGSSRVSALAFAPQGVGVPGVAASDPLLAVADDGPGGGVYLWAAAPARVVTTFADPRSQGFRAVAFSAGGLLAAVGNDGSVDVWNIDSRALDDRIPAQAADEGALSAAFSADGSTLAVGDRSGTTLLWNDAAGAFSASSPSLVSLLGPADSGGVTAVAFASDGTLAAGYGNGEAYVWDAGSQVGVASLQTPTISYAEYGSAVTSAAWADGAGALAVAHADGQVSRSQWTDGQPGQSGPGESPVGYAVPGGEAATAAGWTTTSGDSMLAAGATGGTTYVWDDTSSTGPVKDAGPLGVSVTALSFAPGGTTMATGGSDGKVRLWRVTANL